MPKASIFDIYRGTTHDGPGLRTTVFFKGCTLACEWCHNPEGIDPGQRVWWDSRTCIGCLLCHKACKHGANIPTEAGIKIDVAKCVRCGECVKVCPSKSMTFISREWTADKLIHEVMRDKVYYDRTGGGVTASGGECMMQHRFLAEFFRELHNRGVDTAIDTCGLVSYTAFSKVLPYTNHVLYDLKLMDSALHEKYTGQGNTLVLENVKRIVKEMTEGKINCDLWIRTPLIPGATATTENITAIGNFIAKELRGAVSRWELCAFNNSCITKYERLNLDWKYRNVALIDQKTVQTLQTAALSSGIEEDLFVVSGLITESHDR